MKVVKYNPKILFDIAIKEEKQTIVHCRINYSDNDLFIRVWKIT